jgi:WD40 repeat protein
MNAAPRCTNISLPFPQRVSRKINFSYIYVQMLENKNTVFLVSLQNCNLSVNFVLGLYCPCTQRSLMLDSNQVCAVASCCTFNHNGQLLVAGCSDGTVRIFDLRRSDCIDSWTAHQGETLAIQLTADFTACYSLGSDGKASGFSAASQSVDC